MSEEKAVNREQIKFVKVLRDCPRNERLKSGQWDKTIEYLGGHKGLIYDYDVVVNGVKQARFGRRTYASGYDLLDMDNEFIRVPEWVGSKSTRTIQVKGRGQFESEFLKQRADGRIPTREELDRRIAEKKAKAEAEEARRREENRIEQIKSCGPRLLAALEAMVNDAGGGKKACGHDYTCICAFDEAKAAIAEARSPV